MKSVNELLELFMRQAELEKAMRQPGGARVTEERELDAVRQKLAKLPAEKGLAITSGETDSRNQGGTRMPSLAKVTDPA
jgi:hypothetical protein